MEHKNPFIVEVSRGDMIESIHRGSAAIVDAHGKVIHSWGDINKHMFPRSAIKPVLSLALIETGAADEFALSDIEIALSAASHTGETSHTEAVESWLGRIGLSEGNLECGCHFPSYQTAAHELVLSGKQVSQLHNNCSGKHTGFLTTAIHMGEDPKDYIELDHPVQQRLLNNISEMGDCDLSSTARGVDGCGIPVIGMPLYAMALSMAKMAAPEGLSAERASACKKITTAMSQNPKYVSGSDRFDFDVMSAAPGLFVVKTGAEGVHAGILPSLGLGVALKIEDGAGRAADVAMGAMLDMLGLIDDKMRTKISHFLDLPIKNSADRLVGHARMAKDWLG